MIDIDNLSYQYPGAGALALDGVRLRIERGSLFGLLGPNGAGKTTLISLLTGVLMPAAGQVMINGLALPKAINAVRQLSGFIPQDYAFYPELTARENLQFFAGVQGIERPRKAERVDYCVDFCQLQGVVDQRAGQFSGGLKRRLNIAIGLLTDPPILYFDEPTVSIDPHSRAFILQQIKTLQQQGKTIIYTSHYMEEVEQLCDQLAIMDQGRILQQGTLADLQQAHQQLVIGCERVIDSESLAALADHFTVSAEAKRLTVHCVNGLDDYHQVLRLVEERGLGVASIQYGKANLEQRFLDLTSRQLRD